MTVLLGINTNATSRRATGSMQNAIAAAEEIVWGTPPARRFDSQRIFFQNIQQGGGTLSQYSWPEVTGALDNGRIPIVSSKFDGSSTQWNGTKSLGNGVMWSEMAEAFDGTLGASRLSTINGLLDPWGEKFADFNDSYSQEFIFCWNHEPNSTDDYKLTVLNPGGTSRTNCGLNLAKAFMYTYDRFINVNGCDPAKFRMAPIWIPDQFAFTDNELNNGWWPSSLDFDDYVAYVGVDPYNWAYGKTQTNPAHNPGGSDPPNAPNMATWLASPSSTYIPPLQAASQWRSFEYKMAGQGGDIDKSPLGFAGAKGKQLVIAECATPEADNYDEVIDDRQQGSVLAEYGWFFQGSQPNPQAFTEFEANPTAKAEWIEDAAALLTTTNPSSPWFDMTHIWAWWDNDNEHHFWFDTRESSRQAYETATLGAGFAGGSVTMLGSLPLIGA